jgi:hypothetical protein
MGDDLSSHRVRKCREWSGYTGVPAPRSPGARCPRTVAVEIEGAQWPGSSFFALSARDISFRGLEPRPLGTPPGVSPEGGRAYRELKPRPFMR